VLFGWRALKLAASKNLSLGDDDQGKICSGGTCGHIPDINRAADRIVRIVVFPDLNIWEINTNGVE
jgi:hypothetical protein